MLILVSIIWFMAQNAPQCHRCVECTILCDIVSVVTFPGKSTFKKRTSREFGHYLLSALPSGLGAYTTNLRWVNNYYLKQQLRQPTDIC